MTSVDPLLTLTWLSPSLIGSLKRSMISGGVAVSVESSLGLEASSRACAAAGEARVTIVASIAARARIAVVPRAKGGAVRGVVVT